MNRRHWLKLAAVSSAVSFVPGQLSGREATGSWDTESMQRYSGLLLTWLKENFTKRAEYLNLESNQKFEIKYDYLAPTEDRRKLRLLEKFNEHRLSRKDMEEHISSALAELEGIRKNLAIAEAKAAAEWESKKRQSRPKEALSLIRILPPAGLELSLITARACVLISKNCAPKFHVISTMHTTQR